MPVAIIAMVLLAALADPFRLNISLFTVVHELNPLQMKR